MQIHSSGTLIANRYEVAGRPLVGGMGIVYLCFDHKEQRPVALKTFKPEYLPDRAARERFLEEGNIWVRLGTHPHIVRCYRVFQDSPRPEVYLVLELVAKEEGRKDASLRSWLTPSKPLPVDQALLIALQIVRGMRHATETIPGFVHRDLKPENVLVGADRLSDAPINRVRVTDFGLVKGLRAEQVGHAQGDIDLASRPGQLTRAGSLLGTPHYMAPEQWEGADVTAQADIYALGCILGEMLTGRLLVQGGTPDEVRRAHQNGQTLAGVQGVPAALRKLLAGCLAVEADQRYRGWLVVETALAAAYSQLAGKAAPEAEAAGALSRAERIAAGWSNTEIGYSYLDMGNAQVALAYFERVSHIGHTERERRLQASGIAGIAISHRNLGNARIATKYLEDARSIYHEIGYPHGEGNILVNLGNAYDQLGDVRQAIESYEKALVIIREAGDRSTEASILGNLGVAYKNLGDIKRALKNHSLRLQIAQELGDRRGEGNALANLGVAYVVLGEYRQALEYFEKALVLAKEIGNRRGERDLVGNLAAAHMQLGDAQRASSYRRQALAISREIGDLHGEAIDLAGLADTFTAMGNDRKAIQSYEQALEAFRRIGDRRLEGQVLANLGNAYSHLGLVSRALEKWGQSIAIRHEVGDLNGVAEVSFNIAVIQARQGDRARALPLAQEAARLWSQIGHTTYAQRAQQFAAQLEQVHNPGAGPAPAEIVEQFAPVIDDAVAAAHGDRTARRQMEGTFDMLTENGWMIADPIRHIWAGERDEATLTLGLDTIDALIVREILRRL